MVCKDQIGQILTLADTPKRIISLVPSQTELLYDLGLQDYIVGVTKFCVHPQGAIKEKTIVGGTKQVHFDRINQLRPDIILCNKEENTKEIVETLNKSYTVHVSDIFTIDDALQLIEQYGAIFDKQKEALSIRTTIETEAQVFNEFMKDKPSKKVGYFIWRNPWMAAASDTFIDHLLYRNGFINVFKSKNRYPEIDEKTLKNIEIDYLLLSSEPFPFSEKHIEELRNIVLPDTEIRLVDGEYFSWYGSRLMNAFAYFKTLH